MSLPAKHRDRGPKLPDWTWAVVVGGGVLSYAAVGRLLRGPVFGQEIVNIWQSPHTFASGGVETVAPFVLILIPAVIGAIFTREGLVVLFRGLRRGDPPVTIAKDLALFLLSLVALLVASLLSSSRPAY